MLLLCLFVIIAFFPLVQLNLPLPVDIDVLGQEGHQSAKRIKNHDMLFSLPLLTILTKHTQTLPPVRFSRSLCESVRPAFSIPLLTN
jgi:hypothetical protein